MGSKARSRPMQADASTKRASNTEKRMGRRDGGRRECRRRKGAGGGGGRVWPSADKACWTSACSLRKQDEPRCAGKGKEGGHTTGGDTRARRGVLKQRRERQLTEACQRQPSRAERPAPERRRGTSRGPGPRTSQEEKR